jgi:hypothetical protein
MGWDREGREEDIGGSKERRVVNTRALVLCVPFKQGTRL